MLPKIVIWSTGFWDGLINGSSVNHSGVWNSPGKSNEVGNHSLLQGIFLTQGWNSGLLHCRRASGKTFQRLMSSSSWVRKIPLRRNWQPTPVLLPGESHGQRSLVGYSPWGHKEWDATEPLTHIHTQFIVWSKIIHFQIVNRLDRCIPQAYR